MAMNPKLLRPKATGFDPKSVSGLAAWYDGSVATSVTLNGSTVSQWSDLSGNARHLTQATAASQPTYNASGLKGRGTLSTTGTQWMQASAFATNSTGDYTIFAVMRFGAVTGQPYAFQRGTVNDAHSLLISTANTWGARRGSGNQGTLVQQIDQGSWYIVTLKFKTNLSRVFVGSTQGTDNTTTVAAPSGNKVLTLFALDSSTRAGQPEFAEFLYYHADLASSTQATIRKYLSSKWGVSL
jgi:hypothetical protein